MRRLAILACLLRGERIKINVVGSGTARKDTRIARALIRVYREQHRTFGLKKRRLCLRTYGLDNYVAASGFSACK